jgi:hypothetical protein
MGRITGTLRDSNGQVVTTRANVSVTRRSEEAFGYSRGGSVRPDGSFMITEIPPGDYYVVASVTSGDGPNMTREGAYAPVSVNGNDASIDIRTNRGATVKGRVVIEGTPQPLPPGVGARMGPEAPQIMIQARPTTMGSPLSMVSGYARPVNPAEDGTFELTGLRGPVQITASGFRIALKLVMRGGQDITGKPVEFRGTEPASDVTIVMTHDVGTLEGMVTDERGDPLPGAMVIVFSEDDSRWFQGSPFVHVSGAMPVMPASAMRPSQTAPGPGRAASGRPPRMPGAFMSSSLLPGRWLVVAVPGGSSPPTDRESLEKLRQHAVVATVTAGSAATVHVRAVKAF